jgi:hypothetical protein
MAGKRGGRRAIGVLLLALLAPGTAAAGPYFGEWGWWYHPKDCPRGWYSPLHYWAAELYRARACLRPPNLDQYPPGPCQPVAPSFDISRHRCPATFPAPSSPYADPAAYYGRPILPQPETARPAAPGTGPGADSGWE